TIPDARARVELNATQRVFQSILRRSTLLFRPPYNADAEPTEKQEVKPLQIAAQLNYITVGEFIDPLDWKTEDVDERGNCILLHDGGGDRSETVKLIPMLITELRKKGYQFVTVSHLIGQNRDVI